MSHFYASIEGSAKTAATRQGDARSGISGHIRGWDLGIRVVGQVGAEGNDEFKVFLTGGSNQPASEKLLYIFTAADLLKDPRQSES